jgi:hypothetical protein
MNNKVFKERLGTTARLLPRRSVTSTPPLDDNDNIAAKFEFPKNTYVLLIIFFILVVASFADLPDLLVWPHVVRFASAYVMLISLIKL